MSLEAAACRTTLVWKSAELWPFVQSSVINCLGSEKCVQHHTAILILGLGTTSFAQDEQTAGNLSKRMIERRGVDAVVWGVPAVNYDLMLQEMLAKTDGKVNQILYWSRPVDWHNQTLTPNPELDLPDDLPRHQELAQW